MIFNRDNPTCRHRLRRHGSGGDEATFVDSTANVNIRIAPPTRTNTNLEFSKVQIQTAWLNFVEHYSVPGTSHFDAIRNWLPMDPIN